MLISWLQKGCSISHYHSFSRGHRLKKDKNKKEDIPQNAFLPPANKHVSLHALLLYLHHIINFTSISGKENGFPPLATPQCLIQVWGWNLRVCIASEISSVTKAVGLRTMELGLFKMCELNKLRALPANEKGRRLLGGNQQDLYSTNDVCWNTA